MRAEVAVVAYLIAVATHPMSAMLKGFDLQVYLGGGQQALHHPGNLYSWQFEHHPGIQFTYTPFAALLFAVGSVLPFRALMAGVALVSTFALAAAIWIAFRELGWRGTARLGATLLVAGLVFWTEPVQRALYLGQVELVLMALIVWDLCQPDRRRWKGAATGVAAGIKLVPLLFIAYLLLTRKFRQAAVAAGAFLVTVVIGFIFLPGPSKTWWIDGNFFQAGRTGFVGDQQNQSLRGTLTRLAGTVNGGEPLWLVAAVIVGVLGLAAAVILYNSGQTFAGLMACALTALLVSPISWDHHWVWIAPGLALIIDAGARAAGAARAAWFALAAAVLVVYGGWPDFWSRTAGLLQGGLINYAPASSFAHGDNPAYAEYHWHGLQLIAGNLYLLGGAALFIIVCVAALRAAREHDGLTRSLLAHSLAGRHLLVHPPEPVPVPVLVGRQLLEVRGEPQGQRRRPRDAARVVRGQPHIARAGEGGLPRGYHVRQVRGAALHAHPVAEHERHGEGVDDVGAARLRRGEPVGRDHQRRLVGDHARPRGDERLVRVDLRRAQPGHLVRLEERDRDDHDPGRADERVPCRRPGAERARRAADRHGQPGRHEVRVVVEERRVAQHRHDRDHGDGQHEPLERRRPP